MLRSRVSTDGSVNVFRLLRVPVSKLVAIQGRLQAQGRVHEQTLEQTRRELATLQESLTRKQQDLESRARTIEGTLQAVSQLQVMLGEKAQKIEQRQRQIEQLLQQLSVTLQMPKGQAGQAQDTNYLPETLKQIEAKLDAREKDLAQMYERIQERIAANSMKACKYVTRGMTPSEVRSLLGAPDGEHWPPPWGDDKGDTWTYGTIEVHFDSQAVVADLTGCRR